MWLVVRGVAGENEGFGLTFAGPFQYRCFLSFFFFFFLTGLRGLGLRDMRMTDGYLCDCRLFFSSISLLHG